MIRPSVDEVLMHTAYAWAERGTCERMKVGTVLTKFGRIISTGYNGAPAGQPHCDCKPEDFGTATETCPVSVHAESNAIAFAARAGIATTNTVLYTTMMPCVVCARLLVNAGVIRVVADRSYRNEDGAKLLIASGVVVELAGM